MLFKNSKYERECRFSLCWKCLFTFLSTVVLKIISSICIVDKSEIILYYSFSWLVSTVFGYGRSTHTICLSGLSLGLVIFKMCHNYIFRVPDWVNTIYLWHLQTNNGTLESPLFLRCGCWVAQDHAHDHISVLLHLLPTSTLNLIFRRFCHMQQTASIPCPSQLYAPVILVGPDRPRLRPRLRLALGFLAVICMHFAIQHFKLSPMTGHSCCVLVCVWLYRYGRSRVALSRPDSWASPLCRPWLPFK